ncbi:RNA-dependent DNA polymerase [candidate division KSB1 bacterium]|nr:RNA-dependent DNA polymerase [candidate division KSB1 bacterium]
MKTHRNLFSHIISFENLLCALTNASKGKGSKHNVLRFNYELEDYILQIQAELVNKSYQPGEYQSFYIYDPKKRFISAAPLRDRVVHHALCNIIEPIFDKTFIYDCYANRVNKGTHQAIRRAQKFIKKNVYVLKCDIKKYFPSIDHAILKAEIRRKIADPDTLWLIDTIIDGSNEQEFINDIFPGDDLLTSLERRKGLPLGNLTSQFFANLYLNRFDHFVKEILKFRFYVRYVDDFLLCSNDLNYLKWAKTEIEKYLGWLRLKLHPRKCHILKASNGVLFLGQIIYPEYRILKKANVRKFCQKLSAYEKNRNEQSFDEKRFKASISGWKGHACQANTYRLRSALEEKFAGLEMDLVD